MVEIFQSSPEHQIEAQRMKKMAKNPQKSPESMLRYVDARLEELDTSCGSKNLCGIHGKNSL